MRRPVTVHVTPQPWAGGLVHDAYGAPHTYRLAAEWLGECAHVADWGGAGGAFGRYLPAAVRYTVVDGTVQGTPGQVLADLTSYRVPSDGILLRHVLELNDRWRDILANALAAFRRRLVIVTFTGDAPVSQRLKMKSGWPVHVFRTDEIRLALGPHLVRDLAVQTTHDERIYFAERVQ